MAVVLALVLLLPFLGKALTIDDPLFVWVARHIQDHPRDPYGFAANWFGSLAPMTVNVQNPPATSYWLALAGLASWNESWLHLAMLPWAILLVYGVARLARRLGADPFWAAVLTVGSSAFLVSATTLMCDVMMLCLMTWSIVLWVEGLDRGTWGLLIIGAAIGGLAALTKYFALGVFPLLVVYTVIRGLAEKRPVRSIVSLLPLVVGAALIGIWHLWSQSLYGVSHINGAAKYAQQISQPDFGRYYSAVAFLGGCLVWPLVIGFWRCRLVGRLLLTIAAVFGAFGLWVVMEDKDGAERVTNYVQMLTDNPLLYILGAVFVAAGMAAIYLTLRHLWQRWRDPGAWLLACWVFGALVFLAAINWTVAARNVLPAVPPLALLAAMLPGPGRKKRARQTSADVEQPLNRAVLAGAAVAGLALALVAAWADFSWANTVRQRATELTAGLKQDGRTIYFMGHWGFQYYMEEHGAVALDSNARMSNHDVLVCPQNNTNVDWRVVRPLSQVKELQEPSSWMARLGDPRAGAGFYTIIFGPLPITFSADNSDGYRVYAMKDTAIAPPRPPLPAKR
jgi:4-amino-4-deoxy-L-arabinose transferase-like glycosyltransferase